MPDVFLSYKREDAEAAAALVAALRGAGLDVWWDRDIPPSAPWEATIERALHQARAVIVCWSPASVASDYVKSEARLARDDGRLLQVFLKPCKPPLFFGERQGVDLVGWSGAADDPRIGKVIDAARAVVSGERLHDVAHPPAAPPAPPAVRGSGLAALLSQPRVLGLIAGVVALLAGGATAWWTLHPAGPPKPQTLAVLPFHNLTAADANLVDAIWDDTRGALARNPNLRVLGRTTVEALASQHIDPAGYRSKTGAAYLLDGSVQRTGQRVLINVSLVRTTDGVEVWNDSLGGPLDDVFAFQNRVAGEVEGRIRGRVAPNQGVKPENITTSGEVYAMVADARARIRQRNPDAMRAAVELLKKAVKIDPNYAPAWAYLGQATFMHQVDVDTLPDQRRAEAIGYLRHALVLAPNLAHAHAALAMVQNLEPSTEGEIRRAVALDPGNAEAWMWLGNLLNFQNRLPEALAAHSRVVEMEPLWRPAVVNRLSNLLDLKDEAGVARELARLQRAGDKRLLAYARWDIALFHHRPAEAARILLDLRASPLAQGEGATIDLRLAPILTQLGYFDEAARLEKLPPFVPLLWKGVPETKQALHVGLIRPVDFWVDHELPMIYARLLPRVGRLSELVGYYRAAFHSPDELATAMASAFGYLDLAPNLAADLRTAGDAREAALVLVKAEALIAPMQANGPLHDSILMNLAQLRAAEGRDDEAMAVLGKAVDEGWLPDRMSFAADLSEEPCFARLTTRPAFRALRQRILDRLAHERQVLGKITI